MENKNNASRNDLSDHVEAEFYGDPKIASFDAKIPKFLIMTYILLPIWGIASLWYYWNGSRGWLDRGYWKELQIAANTTFPIQNQNMIEEPKKIDNVDAPTTPN